jgi:probable F420-dependent oxidoreductase
MSVEFGVRLPNSGPLATPEAIVSSAVEAESLGFDSVWVHDHITWGTEQHRGHLSSGSAEALTQAQLPNFYESLITLGFLAGATKKVKLGVAVVVLPLRNPVVLSKQITTLDVLTGGRLLLGIAPGAPKVTEPEFAAVGVDYHKRGKITDDYLKAMQTMWTQPLASYEGKYVSFKEAQMFPKPLQKPWPPILIGGGERGLSPRAMRRVLELGNGWIPAYLTESELAEGIRQLREGSRKAGRGSEKFIVGLEMFVGIGASDEEAAASHSASLTKNFVSVQEGVKRGLVGTTKTIADKIERYEKTGLDFFELKFIYSTTKEFHARMETFAKDVIPSFR